MVAYFTGGGTPKASTVSFFRRSDVAGPPAARWLGSSTSADFAIADLLNGGLPVGLIVGRRENRNRA
jgi:hypothetical protein